MNLVRMALNRPELLRFGKSQGLLAARDDDLGYLVHAWLAATFGALAPKPFWFDEQCALIWGYARAEAKELKEHWQNFADPGAYAVLRPESLQSRPMPQNWRDGLRILLQARLCPVSRRGGDEKDVFLRALDRWDAEGSAPDDPRKPRRVEVYRNWFIRQVGDEALELEQVTVVGMRARVRLLRPARSSAGTRRRHIERPEAQIEAVARVADGQAFEKLLERGIGRHRAFGFGMLRVLPAP